MLQTLINNSCLVTISDMEWTKKTSDLKVFPLDKYTNEQIQYGQNYKFVFSSTAGQELRLQLHMTKDTH